MGAKFYRGSDKPKKIRKRFSQTRSWFRTLKWVACKLSFLMHSAGMLHSVISMPSYEGILPRIMIAGNNV